MSSLIFYTEPSQALIVTDTLAVSHGGEPFLFTSKALYLPHLRTVIAGTGIGRFADDWFRRINSGLLVRGIENLDHHAPRALRKMWAAFQDEDSELRGRTTTIYHFGISEDSGEVVGFANRSANDFESQRLEHGFGVKPPCTIPDGNNLSELIPIILEEQRSSEQQRPVSERIHIGGEAIAIHLTPHACTFSRIHLFADFEDQMRRAMGQLPPQ